MSDTSAMALDWPRVVMFETQDELEEYVESQLNEKGVEPTVALIDSAGTQTTAHRTAPGGDGYGFEYAIGDREPETGGRHCCVCDECPAGKCHNLTRPWSPKFPVWIFEAPR